MIDSAFEKNRFKRVTSCSVIWASFHGIPYHNPHSINVAGSCENIVKIRWYAPGRGEGPESMGWIRPRAGQQRRYCFR
ncbi:hypothetical protein D3C81_1997230 [compost metagenome]